MNFYFVDTISACSEISYTIIGCDQSPGNNFVVESSYAAGVFGGELLAHNVGANNLMDPGINYGLGLNEAEVQTV